MQKKSQFVCHFVKNRKLNLISIFHNKCCICGFNSFPEALEFHHINPSQKKFGLSSNVMKSLDKQIEEAKKCILVCSNCHKGIHAGHIKVPSNYEIFFDEDIAQYLLKENELIKSGKKHYCINCGTSISVKAKRCVVCSNLAQRKVDRPSKEKLQALIYNYSFKEIGRKFNVSDNTIRKWCKKYNLPYKKKDINNLNQNK